MGNRRQSLEPVGATGLKTSWGYVDDDFLQEWRGQNKIKRIREMVDNSPIIATVNLSYEMPLRDIDWTFTSTEGEDDERIQLLNDARDNIVGSWNDHISEALQMVMYGWSLFAQNYERVVDGRILWKEFLTIGHDTIQEWLPEDKGRWGVQQYRYLYPQPIPADRLLHYRLRLNRNNPEGKSILRPAWIPYYFLKNLQQIEAIAYERNGAGYPMVKSPEGASMDEGGQDYTTAHTTARNIRLDQQAGVVVPFGWDVSFLATGSIADFDKPISRYEKRILMATLTQFVMIGMDKVGALSALEGGMDFFTIALNAIADIIADTFTKFAIPQLMKLNGRDAEGLALTHSPVGSIDPSQIVTSLQQAGSLLSWGEQDEAWLRQLLRMPERDETIQRKMEQPQEQMGATARPDFFQSTVYQPSIGDERIDNELELYFEELEALAEQARNRQIDQERFEREMRDKVSAAIILAFILAGANMQSASTQAAIRREQQIAGERIPQLASDIYNGRYSERTTPAPGMPAQTSAEGLAKMRNRLTLWAESMGRAYWGGKNHAEPTAVTGDGEEVAITETWHLGNTEKHCRDCQMLNGVTLTLAEWDRLGLFPKSPELECGAGPHCDCSRTRDGNESDGLENVARLLGV